MTNEQQPQEESRNLHATSASSDKRGASLKDAISTAGSPVVEVHSDDYMLVIGHADFPSIDCDEDSDDIPSYPESTRPQRSEYDAWLG